MKLGQGSTRRVHAIGLALVVAAIAATPARASTPALAGGCDEQQAFIEGDAAAVAERLPQRYTPVKAADGSPLLFARAIRCDSLAADGASGPAVMASYGVLIESPDGLGCGSAAPGVGATRGDQPPICNWYVLSWMADSPRVARWLRAGTPEFPARYVPGLRFQLGNVDPTGGKPFHFEAPDPAPSPFVIDSVGHERPGALSVRGGYWADSPGGTVKVAFSTDDLISGDASGTVTARPGSELSRLIGDHDGSYAPGFSDFSAERWEHASYRKQNLAPSARADSFEGSCSVQGDVSFSPPATNTEGPLRYDYTGSGTCSGTLDGRDVTDAPVELHQSGRSQASCSKHVTSEPGTGTMTFASGETLRFTLDFSGAGTEDDFTFYGDRSGFARGHGTFTTQR
ncbi:MAG: hypothetical protein QOG63_2822, partial [Thermoleophilaceae bacterium]|nr:hypothetical protein [Thermoleophilaceae bacterium]